MLENGLKDHPTHEDMFFTYLQTLILFENTNPLSEGFVSKLQKALKMNPQRLCQWIESNYQLLHFTHLKNLYCKNCLAQ
ncbi:hypothetical protein AsAng_0019420 [Aureispira anguillae]|uniref:Uncharacterized protein n=1 Tax=Aureispira anguillae TaxID=2864201 RepID=A0A916DSL1_9BACT|nr:hypothetical protein AsAng_0019420 [Aureispira anguillae]